MTASSPSRPSGRPAHALRKVTLDINVSKHAEGSCLVKFGDTHVLCTASLETRVPPWLRGQGRGWVTAEYGMLPRATGERMRREANAGKQSGRTQEIQRLIGRSLRAVVNLEALGENQISLDCDVIQADGGTRTAAITGAWVALYLCVAKMKADGLMSTPVMGGVISDHVAALSCGIYQGLPVADLDYDEDSVADTDGNFVMTGSGKLVEIQATAEGAAFDEAEFQTLMDLAKTGIAELVALQKQAVGL
ncbi:MAG: ribonuclease PH [PS1 clade bacterium]|nr:ribonuclease PH [PS1 clade bacterium]MBL6783649.1 ribonuclease PH [PS1 clade bacterium]